MSEHALWLCSVFYFPSPSVFIQAYFLLSTHMASRAWKTHLENSSFPDMTVVEWQFKLWFVGSKIRYSKFLSLPQMHLYLNCDYSTFTLLLIEGSCLPLYFVRRLNLIWSLKQTTGPFHCYWRVHLQLRESWLELCWIYSGARVLFFPFRAGHGDW